MSNEKSSIIQGMKSSPKLVLVRHGQSVWNKCNLFTGWVDVPLSQVGIEEALLVGKQISAIPFDTIFMSSLIRAQMTAMIALSVHTQKKIPIILHPELKKQKGWDHNHNPKAKEMTIPVITAWELNERMYGDLQGHNKDDMRQKFGAEQIKIWRRSFDTPPPNGESLKDTASRSIPYFENQILPHLEQGENVLVSAHGNSLRSIVMFLENLSENQVLNLEIPTGGILCYSFEKGKWKQEKINQVQQSYQKGI